MNELLFIIFCIWSAFGFMLFIKNSGIFYNIKNSWKKILFVFLCGPFTCLVMLLYYLGYALSLLLNPLINKISNWLIK